MKPTPTTSDICSSAHPPLVDTGVLGRGPRALPRTSPQDGGGCGQHSACGRKAPGWIGPRNDGALTGRRRWPPDFTEAESELSLTL